MSIVSPATTVRPEYIDGAVRLLASEGFEPVVMAHAKGPAQGSYAAGDSDRLDDIMQALGDPSVRAIFCARGGYGCNHLLDKIPAEAVAADPKWLVGFSDVSALHALWQNAGVVSLHAPMAKHLATLGPDHYCTQALMRVLREGLPVQYVVPSHPYNRRGEATGMLVGGNLAVINGLADTPFDPLRRDGAILFVEDISEKIYAVERMLIRLRLGGRLERLKGLIFGQFTDYPADMNYADMETMASDVIGDLQIPVCFNFPAGHVDDNLPLALGSEATLCVGEEETILTLC